MKKELENFIIESDVTIDYFDEIVDYILENEKRILEFFKIPKMQNKIIILILSYKPFKDFIVSKYGEILDYVVGNSNTSTHTIRILNVEDQIKYSSHKNANIDYLKKGVLHEIVHQCHHTYHKDSPQTIWFSEGLACNLSNQYNKKENLKDCDFDKLKNNFYHYKNSYRYAFVITNYILKNYSKKEIYKLYSDYHYLNKKADKIFEEAKEWSNT